MGKYIFLLSLLLSAAVVCNGKSVDDADILCQKALEEYYQHDDAPKALPLFQQAAEKGHSRAQFMLGLYYWQGIYIEKDAAKSFYWLKKSADNGYPDGCHFTGVAYLYGLVV